jgi:hypothetical protein
MHDSEALTRACGISSFLLFHRADLKVSATALLQEFPRCRGLAARCWFSGQILFQALEVAGQIDVGAALQE